MLQRKKKPEKSKGIPVKPVQDLCVFICLSSRFWNFGSNVVVALHWFSLSRCDVEMLKYSAAAEKILKLKYNENNTWRHLLEDYIHI